jgi:Fe-S-cluster-containing hydrogenase component 2/CRP-like cAMP-binding protein
VTEPALELKKAKKPPPKKGGKGGGGEGPAPVTPEKLAEVPLFSRLDDALRARLAPRTTWVEIARGEALFDGAPLADEESPVFVVVKGDVDVRRQRKGDKLEIVNYLSPGEAYFQKLFVSDETERLVLTAMCPVQALRVSYRDVNYVLKKAPEFRDDFSAAIKHVTERQTSRFDDGFQREISKFFVEQRLTFAGRVKVKRMDICIECDGCYDACRERHGTDRLGPSEVKYGLTEIPQNCHNCLVPECMDKCKFGHITISPETKEIVISDNCVGCTQCSRGCSFGAIRMHSLADLDLAKYFPDRKPDAKGKSIAQKCDNCTGYPDQACITACPTGALFQVDGARIFEYWQQFNVHQTPGHEAVASPEADTRRIRNAWIAFTLLNTLVLAWECLGRLHWPSLTFAELAFRMGFAATGVDPVEPFREGDAFSHALGYIGWALLGATQLYRLGKRFAPRFGSVPAWMEAHIYLGVLGGVYGLFHTAFSFHGLISLAAFFTMVLAIATGVLGRFVLYLVPRSRAGAQLELADLEARIRQLDRDIQHCFVDPREGATVMVKMEDLVAPPPGADAEGERAPLWTGLVRLLGEDRAEKKKLVTLAAEIDGGSLQADRARALLRLMREKARAERSMRRHTFFARLLKRYRVVHVVASNIMFGALLLHVVYSLIYQVSN